MANPRRVNTGRIRPRVTMTSEEELEYQKKILKLLQRVAALEARVAELSAAIELPSG